MLSFLHNCEWQPILSPLYKTKAVQLWQTLSFSSSPREQSWTPSHTFSNEIHLPSPHTNSLSSHAVRKWTHKWDTNNSKKLQNSCDSIVFVILLAHNFMKEVLKRMRCKKVKIFASPEIRNNVIDLRKYATYIKKWN